METKSSRIGLSCFVVLLALANGLVFLGARLVHPIPQVSGERFWFHAIGDPQALFTGTDTFGIYPPVDGWRFLYYTEHHGIRVMRASGEEVRRAFVSSQETLDGFISSGDAPYPVVKAYESWAADPALQGNPDALIEEILRTTKSYDADERTYQGTATASDPRDYPLASQYQAAWGVDSAEYIEQRWNRAKRRWLNIAFECFFLSACAVVAGLPLIRPLSPVRVGLLIGVLPLFFYMPFYLGYAPWTFTFGGLTDGVVYPILVLLSGLVLAGIPVTQLDESIAYALPQILAPLNLVNLQPMTGTENPVPSVLGICSLGVILGGLAYSHRRWRIKRTQAPREARAAVD